MGSDLQFDRFALRTDDSRVERLVHVELRHGDEVLEPPGNRTPPRVDDSQCAVAVTNVVDEDPHSHQVVNISEVPTAHNHLLVDGVIVLGSACHTRFHLGLTQIRIDFIEHEREVLVP